jgi:hypothetical protein
MYEIKRNDDDVSASKVREALKIDDEKEYKAMTPKSLHKMYNTLKEIIQDVKESFGLLSFSEFLNENYTMVNEKRVPKTIYSKWEEAYDKWSKGRRDISGVRVDVKDKGESLRAIFGGGSLGEKNVIDFLSSIGIQQGSYDMESLGPSEQKPEISGQFRAYYITFNSPVSVNGLEYNTDQQVIILDKVPENKSGEGAVITKKDVTPDNLGLASPGAQYKTANALYSSAEKAIKALKIPSNYKKFIIGLMDCILQDNSNAGLYEDINDFFMESYDTVNLRQLYDIPDNLFKGIDDVSIANISNDFGEVLGALHMFHVLRKTTTGTTYPSSSNAKLVDFYFDGQKISSKAGTKGGTASATGFIDILNAKIKAGIIALDGDNLNFYNEVLTSIDKNSTLEFYVDMLNKFLYYKGTAWYYLLNQSKIAQNNVNKDSVIAWLIELHKNKK